MFVHRRRNLQKTNTLEFCLLFVVPLHIHICKKGFTALLQKMLQAFYLSFDMRNPKLFLAFVTTKDDDEEFMIPGYYRFFFPLLQLSQHIWRDNRAVNLERETELANCRETESMNLVPHFPRGLGFSGLASSLYKTSRHQWWVCLFDRVTSSFSNCHQLWVLNHQVRRGRRRRRWRGSASVSH